MLDPRCQSPAELGRTIDYMERCLAALRKELGARPTEGEPKFEGFTDRQGRLVGFPNRHEAYKAIVQEFPDTDPEWLNYQIHSYYRHKGEV